LIHHFRRFGRRPRTSAQPNKRTFSESRLMSQKGPKPEVDRLFDHLGEATG
jgi:hypothetical protein